MMKPDTDTEKYSGHNIRNNMFIKTLGHYVGKKKFHITLFHP